MKKLQYGRTMIETLAILAIIGILSVSGLQLYSKAMNTIRANYIMERVYIKANELIENPVATRHRMVDVKTDTNNLSYGYRIDTGATGLSGDKTTITVKLNGYFPTNLCKILKKKITSQEYSGLKQIIANETALETNSCPSDSITSMTFTIDSEFKHQAS